MVASGLVGRVDVAPYRLATHLTLACIVLVALVWTAVGLAPPRHAGKPTPARTHAMLAIALLILTLSQVFLGALVAGNKAGLVYKHWPMIDGGLLPRAEAYFFLEPAWHNWFENHLAVQFNHRIMAYALVLLTFLHAWRMRGEAEARGAMHLAGIMLGQAILGIITLLLVAPVWAALLHQAYAALILVSVTAHARRLSLAARGT